MIIDGKKISGIIKEEVKEEAAELLKLGLKPTLAVVLVGLDPASMVYVKNKKLACSQTNIGSISYELPESTTEEELLSLIDNLNNDKSINGVLVQLPLPAHIDENKVILKIKPEKDVDCFHPVNVGLLQMGAGSLLPCTPAGIIELLKRSGIEISGKNCTVVGRSNIVGKPVASLLLKENATVTITHSKTKNLSEILQNADIIVAAIGKACFITREMVKEGAVIIDVGINRIGGKLYGDVDFEGLEGKASYITPVPGGVGPMTIAMLMKNCLNACKQQNNNI
ncbi:MAG: bifunctional methylenetetrahydrofolate dehydrogenase/methenyltetrahydrofolate cyclohydrolase FolD [Clostridiales bacterium]|jgi:methylenetetrahydrofolate dehydrogenase (NADP+)/methenyltetrahydrofolate cyclohydrolase|nr:bifunctional methylenetetrahydrofolate dehydrogenase/methenyltetrahydrofolate cyclohydrolase FolD [Clostridiales bacterium]